MRGIDPWRARQRWHDRGRHHARDHLRGLQLPVLRLQLDGLARLAGTTDPRAYDGERGRWRRAHLESGDEALGVPLRPLSLELAVPVQRALIHRRPPAALLRHLPALHDRDRSAEAGLPRQAGVDPRRREGRLAQHLLAREATAVEIERALPRGARLLVAGRLGVLERRFEEAVTEAGIDVELVFHPGRFDDRAQLLDIVHARTLVLIATVAEDRAVHLRRDLDRRRVGPGVGRKAVVRDRRGAI